MCNRSAAVGRCPNPRARYSQLFLRRATFCSAQADFLRDDMSAMVDNLTDAVSGQMLNPWDLDAGKTRAALALSTQSPEDQVADAVHAGAFRHTLGRPIQCPAYKIAAITAEDLQSFTASNFTAGNMTVVGRGVDHDALVAQLEDNLSGLPVDDTPSASAKYYGGFESRLDAHSVSQPFMRNLPGVGGNVGVQPHSWRARVNGDLFSSGCAVPKLWGTDPTPSIIHLHWPFSCAGCGTRRHRVRRRRCRKRR